jgi:hypothetical protein
MFELPTKPQSIAKILEEGIKLFVLCFPKVLLLILIDISLSILLHLLIPELNSSEPEVTIAAVMDSMVFLFLYMIAMLVLHTAIFYQIGAIISHSDKGSFDALLQALQKLLPIFLATWLYAFLVGIGLMVVIPGIFFAVSLRFFTPLILFENATVHEALQQSYQLVRGNWWQTAAILTVPLFAAMFISVMLSGIVEGFLMSSTTMIKDNVNFWIQIIYLTVDKLFNPLFYAIILMQYYDLKRRSKQHGFEKQFIA